MITPQEIFESIPANLRGKFSCYDLDCMSRAYKSKIGAWQPIETAPGNGDVFIAYAPHDDRTVGGFQFMGYRRTDTGAIACMMSGDLFPQATHWMPQRENPTDEIAALKSAMAEQINSLENS